MPSAEVEAGLAVVEDTGSVLGVLSYDAILAKIAIHRGDLPMAKAHLEAGTKRFADGVEVYGVDVLFAAQAEFLAASGQPEAALKVAETLWAQTARVRYLFGSRARSVFLVRLAVAAGRDELAATVSAELEEGSRRSPAASAAGAALLCRGLVERDPDLMLGAVAKYRETPLRPDLAACCEAAADVLAAARRSDEAVELLQEASTINADIDAVADAARVDAALLALGVDRPRRRVRRPSFGWDSLTPMESDVSRLAAQGLSQPRDRRPALHLASHRRDAPLARVQKGRRRRPDPSRRRAHAAWPTSRTAEPRSASTSDAAAADDMKWRPQP